MCVNIVRMYSKVASILIFKIDNNNDINNNNMQ